jgi:hypothetical protein
MLWRPYGVQATVWAYGQREGTSKTELFPNRFFAEHVLLIGPMATVSVVAVGAPSGGVKSRFGSASSSLGDLNGGATTNC